MTYKGVAIGEYVPDLVAYDQLVIDTKVVERISNQEVGQMVNCLKMTGFQVRPILNFRHPKLEWRRIVLERDLDGRK